MRTWKRDQTAGNWVPRKFAPADAGSSSSDDVRERCRHALRAASKYGTCGGTRVWQAAVRKRRRGMANGQGWSSCVSVSNSKGCAGSCEKQEMFLPHAGFAGWAALRLCVSVAFGLGVCLTPERACGLRGLRARRVGCRRVCVARCGLGVFGSGVRRRRRGAGRVSMRGAPRWSDSEMERVLEDVAAARRKEGRCGGGVEERSMAWSLATQEMSCLRCEGSIRGAAIACLDDHALFAGPFHVGCVDVRRPWICMNFFAGAAGKLGLLGCLSR